MKKISRETSLKEVASIISEELKKSGIDAILVGGAVVSIYTQNEYESYDLDFILPGLAKNVSETMEVLGYQKNRSRHWIHPKNPYLVEFPGSVLAIGDSLDVELAEIKTKMGVIKLLSPTSSVMDRLAAFFHWNDLQGFDQAIMIAKNKPINLKKVEQWSKKEGFLEKYKKFRKHLREI